MHVKAGSIIPFGPDIQFVGEKPDAPLTLFVYGEANAEFSLYEDEGLNYNYEKGEYSKISFRYDHQAKTLEIGEREGSYAGMPAERTFHVVLVDREHPRPMNLTTRPDTSVKYTGTALRLGL
jgi:alpha-D-xyloside xylohydrolase